MHTVDVKRSSSGDMGNVTGYDGRIRRKLSHGQGTGEQRKYGKGNSAHEQQGK